MIRKFLPELFKSESKAGEQAREIAGRTYELSQFLVGILGVEDTGARCDDSVTYHDSCHLLRELHVSEEPRRLIRNVRGIDFRELEDRNRCCGFGGTFSINFADVSCAIGEDKVAAIEATGARSVVSTDAGCLLHLSGLLKRRGSSIKTVHIAEVLARFDD